MQIHTSLISIVAVGILASCSGPKHVYKDFYTSQEYRKAGVLSDATILQDAPGKIDNFLVDKSTELLNSVHQGAMQQLRAKGYAVSSKYRSTGLSLPPESNAFISNDPKASSGDPLVGPHYIGKTGQGITKTEKYAAERLFERLLQLDLLAKSAKEAAFPEIKDLSLSSDEYVVVISGLSRNVNVSKQVGQALLIAAVSLGSVVAWESDAAVIQVALLDPKTQRIVWANQIIGGTGGISKQLENVFEPLPNFGSSGL